MKAYYKNVGLERLCELVGKTRQAFYDSEKRFEKQQFDASIIVNQVIAERAIAKRVGGKKLYLILKSTMEKHGIKIGRDKFMAVLGANDLLVKRRRRRFSTTMSRHRLRKYPNLIRDLKINSSEELWVSDLTYLSVEGGHCYLILITDAYCRKVVGYNFGRSMDTAFCLEALKQAQEARRFPERELLHHSDRGVQYCSKKYVEELQRNNIKISMTENGDPLENPLAERMNRIFKDSFGLDEEFDSFDKAKNTVDKAIEYYNNRLPHSSIDMLTPNQAYEKTGYLKKHWKWYWKEKQEALQNETPVA